MSLKPKAATADSPAAKFAATVVKLEHKTNAIKLTPGHGVAGRHATRALLDALSGNKDPGMFGRMFPTLPPLTVSDAKLQALANAMIDSNPGRSGRQQSEHPVRASPISASSSITTSRST